MRQVLRQYGVAMIGVAVALCVVATSQPASAQAGYIGVYSDLAGTDCTAPDTPNGFLPVYIIHQATAGSAAVQAALQSSFPAGFVHLGETSPYPTTLGSLWLHDDGAGGAVAYGACVSSPNLMKTVNLLTLGINPLCTSLCIVPDPSTLTGTIEVVDCANNKLVGVGECLNVNSDASCNICNIPPPPPPDPVLLVTPASLNFGSATVQLGINIINSGNGTLMWSIVETLPWLSVSLTSGSGNASITVTVNRAGLPVGTYTGQISVLSNGGDINVDVEMTVIVGPPSLNVSPTSRVLAYDESTFDLNISNVGDGTLLWSIASNQAWLSAAPDTGSGDATVLVSVDRTGLADGMHTGVLHVASNGGSADVTVFMSVQTSPLLSVVPTAISFTSTSQVRTFQISNIGPGTLTWSLAPSQPWIVVAPGAGSGDATVIVTLDSGSIGSQTSGQIAVTSNGGNETVQVNLVPGGVPGYLGVYTDPGGTDCVAPDTPNALLPLYIIHKATTGAAAVQVGLQTTNPAGFIHLGETSPFPTIIGSMWVHSDGQGGSVAYGGCYPAPVLVKTVNLMTLGNNPVCTSLCIVPDPTSLTGTIEVVDCANNKLIGLGDCMIVKSNGACGGCDAPTDVRSSTWGGIKAQYMNWDTNEFRARQKR